MRITTIFTLLLLFASACTPVSAANPTPTNLADTQLSLTPTAITLNGDCGLEPVEAPNLPDTIPAYGEIDPATGLHMTGEALEVDLDSYRLKVSGLVDNPLSLTYDQLRCLPKVSDDPLLDCPGFFQDKATWAGASLSAVLTLAQPQADASKISMVSADGYRTEMDLEQAWEDWNFLAYELEGEPLPALHGFPVRAVFPGLYGSYWAKWLVEIEIK
jgi:DMSO/TMAO reductase YedYZ molybdopterin-dependent catalytic subunit